MSKTKQSKTETTTTINNGGKANPGYRTRIAARDGIGSAQQQLRVLDAICVDHADYESEIDSNLLLKSIGKVQSLVGLSIRAAAETRRNPQFKSTFFLQA